MSTFSSWFSWMGRMTQAENRKKRKKTKRPPSRRIILNVEQLEDRDVPSLLGAELFPADYPWNQNIANAPVAANSAAVISKIGATVKVHADWGVANPANVGDPLYGIPFNVVHGNDPNVTRVNVIIDNYPDESDIIPVPMPANPVIEGDFQSGPNPNTGNRGDSHLIVWDVDNNIAYELFVASRPTENADGKWHAAQESVWHMNANDFRTPSDTSADAAGLSILAGLARPDEALPVAQGGQGEIDHAIRFTLPSSMVLNKYIYPASHKVLNNTTANNLPMGSRLRLANTPAVNAKIAAMGPQAQAIAHAMQQYGLVLADVGSSMFITGTSASVNANNQTTFVWNMNDALGIQNLVAGDFQLVDLTPTVTGLSASSGAAGSTITVVGQNFSGSAGHLSVLFGNTPSASVTYVDDSHLTVVVPNGTGTVDVRVQSGVNQVDSNNIKNPIFGYGTSAVVAVDQFTFVAATPIAVSSVVVNGNNSALAGPQRSMVSSIEYQFNQAVNLGPGAFSITLNASATGGPAGILPTINYSTSNGGLSWVVTFSGAGVVGGSIANGVYNITLNSSAVSAVSGGGTLAASRTDTFYRLYGDINGDKRVNATDLAQMNNTFGLRSTQVGFIAGFDVNNDGRINATDLAQLNNTFGIRYLGFTNTI